MPEALTDEKLDSVHHVAVIVNDIDEAVRWYRETFRCEIAYSDSTWAMLKFANCHLALVAPGGHPPHLGFLTPAAEAERFGKLKPHRDGTSSVYVADPSGNPVELLVDERGEEGGSG